MNHNCKQANEPRWVRSVLCTAFTARASKTFMCATMALALMLGPAAGDAAADTLEWAFAFGSRNLECETPNAPGTYYTIVLHENTLSPLLNVDLMAYDPVKGFGYERVYSVLVAGLEDPNLPLSPYGVRDGFGVFGPFDSTPNNRNAFGDDCPEELYDSFIGAKDFQTPCNETVCDDTEGIVFRVDVPNGRYRFVAAFGDADNPHAHRILAQDGGSGGPEDIGPNHVVLVDDFDQSQYDIGEPDASRPGVGVYARVGFDGKMPPMGDGIFPDPQFVNMNEFGLPTSGSPNSPVLEVTEGYIRIHQLQGNSNPGPGAEDNDPNGGDMVVLEIWRVPVPDGLIVEKIAGLVAHVLALNLAQGITNSLDGKLDAALNALDDINANNDVAAINTLVAFINAVEAQRGNKIADADADALRTAAENIIALLTAR